MSCACEHKKLGMEIDRFRRLAKVFAQMEDANVVLYKNPDGTYGFCKASSETTNQIIEYITPY